DVWPAIDRVYTVTDCPLDHGGRQLTAGHTGSVLGIDRVLGDDVRERVGEEAELEPVLSPVDGARDRPVLDVSLQLGEGGDVLEVLDPTLQLADLGHGVAGRLLPLDLGGREPGLDDLRDLPELGELLVTHAG